MPWKQDDDGNVVTLEGAPVWVNSEGAESAYNADKEQGALRTANHEAGERRKALTGLREELDGLGPLTEFLSDEADAAAIAKEFRTLRRNAKNAPKGGELDDDTKAKLAALDKLEEQVEESRAALLGKDKELTSLVESNAATQGQIQRLTVGRGVRTSKWFSAQNGNAALTTMHPDQAEDYFSPFGAPDPDNAGKVIWYKTAEAATKRDATEMIRGDDGKPAGVNAAIEVLGPTFGWWATYKAKPGHTTSDQHSTDETVTVGTKLTKADLNNPLTVIEYAKKYGHEAAQQEMRRVLSP